MSCGPGSNVVEVVALNLLLWTLMDEVWVDRFLAVSFAWNVASRPSMFRSLSDTFLLTTSHKSRGSFD